MKRNSILYALTGIAVWGLASCSGSDDVLPERTDGRVPVELTNNIIGATTRAATTLNETALTTGDITVRTSEAYATAYTYAAGDGGAMTSAAPAYYPAGGVAIDIVAYSPANAADGTSETFTVGADQTSDAAYIASDLLWAKAEGKTSASGAVNIAFSHQMAKIIVNVTAGKGISTIQSITLKNIKRQCTFNYETGAVSDVAAVSGATDVAVTTGGTTASSTGAACIPAQSLMGDFIEIVTDKGTDTYRLSSEKPVGAGNYYTINLTLNLAAVGTTNTIEAWSDQGSVNILPTSGDWTVSVSGTYTYNGSSIVPDAANITVHSTSDDVDIDAANYNVYVDNNINAGEASLIVYGTGAYAGEFAYCTYTIAKAEASISFAAATVSKNTNSLDFILDLTNTGDGTMTNYTSSDESVAKVNSTTGEVDVLTAGTTRITATVADGGNYTYPTKTAYYDITVVEAVTTISALKTMINEGIDCTSFLGFQVNAAGDINNTVTDPVGYISYVSTSDVDTSVPGSRILVLAASPANTPYNGDAKWDDYNVRNTNSDSGYSNTNTLKNYYNNAISGNQAGYYAWNHSAAIPDGGSSPAHCFLPSSVQILNCWTALGGLTSWWPKGYYWTSTEIDRSYARCLSDNGSIQNDFKANFVHVRACFAF